MAEDMTIDKVAETYHVSRSTVERAINKGLLRAHDGFNEQHNPATMIEPDDALHWWNTRKPRRKYRPAQVTAIIGDVLDADAAADDDEDADGDGGADDENGHRAVMQVGDAVQMTVALYARGAWLAGYRTSQQQIGEERGRRLAAEQRAQAAAAEAAALRERAVRAEEVVRQAPPRRGLWARLRGKG